MPAPQMWHPLILFILCDRGFQLSLSPIMLAVVHKQGVMLRTPGSPWSSRCRPCTAAQLWRGWQSHSLTDKIHKRTYLDTHSGHCACCCLCLLSRPHYVSLKQRMCRMSLLGLFCLYTRSLLPLYQVSSLPPRGDLSHWPVVVAGQKLTQHLHLCQECWAFS
jgi:hypothetical protein